MSDGRTASGKIWVPEIYQDGPQAVLYPQAGAPILDPSQAMASALGAYLARLQFVRWGRGAPNTVFQLREVFDDWPEPDVELPYPCASISEMTPSTLEAHDFVPRPLEKTWNQYGENTVLWKLAEMALDFQVDFFTNDAPTRDAITARLPSAFSPGEDGTRIVLCGDCRYWDRPVRASLPRDYERIDEPDAVYARERRVRATIRCEIDVVDLRCASALHPSAPLVAVGETVNPGPSPVATSPIPPCED